jgi:methylated-DNA-[protein]-cysteine S-methyltransferase
MSSSSRYQAARSRARAVVVWDSPLGPIEILGSERGLCCVEFLPRGVDGPCSSGSAGDFAARSNEPKTPVSGHYDSETDERARLWVTCGQSELVEYFDGSRRSFSVPLDLNGASFQMSVWNVLLGLAYGGRLTYRELAAAAGRPAAIRAAGAANGANPIAIIVPCHRVLGTNGSLTGYAGGLERKHWLLEHEQAVLERAHSSSMTAPTRG